MTTSQTTHRAITRRAMGLMSLGVLLSASGAWAAGPDPLTIVIGQQGSETEAIFVESGVFADAPYKVDFATFAGPVDTLAALASGRIDIANNVAQWTATQAAAASPVPWTPATAPYKNALVTGPGNAEKFDRFVVAASAQSKITDLSQTKGKKWGIARGASGHLLASKVLEKLGWTFDDIEFVGIDSTNSVLALQNGTVDLVFGSHDNLVPALVAGARIIGESHEYDTTIYTGYLMNVKALDDPQRGAILKDVAIRIIKAHDWYNRNPDLGQKALVKYRKLTPEQAAVAWTYTRYLPLPAKSIAAYSQRLTDAAVRAKLLNRPVDATALLDDRFDATIAETLEKIGYVANLQASYTRN